MRVSQRDQTDIHTVSDGWRGKGSGGFTGRKKLESRGGPTGCAGQSLQAPRIQQSMGVGGRGAVGVGEHTCFTDRQTKCKLGALANQASKIQGPAQRTPLFITKS